MYKLNQFKGKGQKFGALMLLVALFASFSAPSALAFSDFNISELYAAREAAEAAYLASVTPKISTPYVDPIMFNPGKGEKATIYFELNTNARAFVDIFQGETVVKNLAFERPLTAGSYSFAWDGSTKTGPIASDGVYQFKIYVTNDFGYDIYPAKTTDFASIIVTSTPPEAKPALSDVSASQATFKPSSGEKTAIRFSLNGGANVSVDIMQGTSLVKNLLFDKLLSSGSYTYEWDGRNKDGLVVADGGYEYKIYAANSSGFDLKGGNVVVASTPVTLLALSSVKAEPATFNPDTQRTTISFNVNTVGTIEVRIFDGATLVKRFEDITAASSGNYSVAWNGRDNSGSKVSAKAYTFQVYAYNTVHTDIKGDTVTVVYAPLLTAPTITALSAIPATFNPSLENTTLTYTVNKSATVTTEVLDSTGSVLRTLESGSSRLAGTYSVVWNGQNSAGIIVGNGSYALRVTATNSAGSDTKSTTATVTSSTLLTAPTITALSAIPATFNPSLENTTIIYTLDKSAIVLVQILNSAGVLLRSLEIEVFKPAGVNNITWNGLNFFGSAVSNGTYTVRVKAGNSAGSDIKTTTVTVAYAPSLTAPIVSDLGVNPVVFRPGVENTTISYTLDKSANVTVQILNSVGSVLRTLESGSSRLAGPNRVMWNGQDGAGSLMSNGVYTVRVTAGNSAGSNTKSTTVTVDNNLPGTAPVLSSLYASLSPFNPNTQETTLNYTLDKPATVTVQILDASGRVLRVLESGSSKSAGIKNISWNGRDSSGSIVSENTYTFRVTALNDFGSDFKNGLVIVNYGTSGTLPVISNPYAIPTTFNPNNENTTLYYTLDKPATVTVQILESGNYVVRTLEQNVSRGSGTSTILWNGRDSNNNIVSAGFYSLRVTAANSYGSDARTVSVNVKYTNGSGVSGTMLRNLFVNPETFNPNRGASASVYFNLTKAGNVTVEVLDKNNNVIRTLVDNVYRNPSSTPPYSTSFGTYNYSDSWNGRDRFGSLVSDNIYQFRVRAASGSESDSFTAYVEVDTDGVIIGFPTTVNCIGFKDVTRFSPYCEAIKVMKEDGVFGGYPDGTFRPYQSINRAETVKVVLLAMRTPIVADFLVTLFSDVGSNVWYAQYLNIAKRLGIIRGYPDGTFRPMQTVNRVELLKIFFEAIGAKVAYCNAAPYLDTPVNASTRWYIDYVCNAKNNNLMRDDGTGRFNPAAPMTRGDVADLFYQYESRGMFSGSSQYSRY